MQPLKPSGRSGAVFVRRCAVGAATLGAALHLGAAAPSPAGPASRAIYACYAGGKVIKSDQQFGDCAGVQTRAIAGMVERILSPEQTALQEKCAKDKTESMAEWRTTDRSNKNLLGKYPDIASLRAARDADLASAREAVTRSQTRLVDLEKEHRRLLLEREFYPDAGTVPPKLQRGLDDNGALIAAQQQGLKKAQDDVARIGANFDALEKKMKELWLGRAAPQPSVDCSADSLFGPVPVR